MPVRPRILALFGGGVLFGQERGNIEALNALRASGSEVLCLVRDDDWSVVPAALDANRLPYRKVTYIEQRFPGRTMAFLFRNPTRFLRANWQFRRIVKEFQPTHIYAFNSFYVLNFLLGLALMRTPLIYRAGDAPTRHNAFFRWLWSFVVGRTWHFVANSRFVESELISSGVLPSRITVIYNRPPARSCDHPVLLPPSSSDSTRINISYVGQLVEAKGVHLLVEAFRKVAPHFPNALLLVAGRLSDWEGDAWARHLAERVSQDSLLQGRVIFLGFVEDVAGLLRQSKVHVCPSLMEEPSANVVMEAKEAGIPSIVFPSGGLPELVEDGVDGLVCETKSVECLTKALLRYLRDPALVERHGLSAHASLERLGVARFEERWGRVVGEAAS